MSPADAPSLLARFGRSLVLPAAFAALAVAVLPFDLRVARFADDHELPNLLRELLELGENFGHGLGVALASLLILTLVPVDRRKVSRLLWAAFGAGGLANVVKLTFFRFRPYHYPLHEAAADDPLMTFVTPPGFTGEGLSASFPSGHTATAFALAAVLSAYYPRGRWLFWSLAMLCATQRVWANAHFPSDVFAAACVGLLTARLFLSPAVGRWGGFDWWERRGARQEAVPAAERHYSAAA